MVAFLRERGGQEVDHTEGTYVGHCAAVYRDLKVWGAPEWLARAGFFHSVYGTELFQRFKLELSERPAVRALIGERAEHLAYLNCSITYEQFDQLLDRESSPYPLRGRMDGAVHELSDDDFRDLLLIHLVDRLEQVPRSKKFSWRRDAFRRIAERLGSDALAQYASVYPAA